LGASGYTTGTLAGRQLDRRSRRLRCPQPHRHLIKQIRLNEKLSLEGQAQVFNVFNNTNFNPVNQCIRFVSDHRRHRSEPDDAVGIPDQLLTSEEPRHHRRGEQPRR
jgi:hypothetical protein